MDGPGEGTGAGALVAEDDNIQIQRGVMVKAATDTGFFAGVPITNDLSIL